MAHLSLRNRLIGLNAITIASLVFALNSPDRVAFSLSTWATIGAFILILTAVERADVSIPLSSTTLRISVGASIGLAAAIQLGPALGCIIVLIGHLLDSVLARRDPIKSLTNVCTFVTATSLGGLFYWSVASAASSPVGSSQNILASLGASAVHIAISTLLMASIVAPIVGMPIISFIQSAIRLLAMETLAMPAVAGMIVVAAKENAFAIILLSFPLLGPQVAYRTLARAQQSVRATLESLTDVVERRDPYTANHSERVSRYVRRTLQEMPDIPFDLIETIVAAARVHDLGKVGTRDLILFKPGPLTTEERREIQRHTVIGSELLSVSDEYHLMALIVRHHHEFWNGAGYPDHIAGEDIPLGSRIIAVADAFDTMTTDRPYRTAMPVAAALEEIRRSSGTQFDPHVVRAFLQVFGTANKATLEPASNKKYATSAT